MRPPVLLAVLQSQPGCGPQVVIGGQTFLTDLPPLPDNTESDRKVAKPELFPWQHNANETIEEFNKMDVITVTKWRLHPVTTYRDCQDRSWKAVEGAPGVQPAHY